MTWLVQYGQGREVREKVRNAAADVLAGGRLSELAEKTLRGFDRAFARSFGIAVKYEDAPTIFEGRDRAVLRVIEAAFSIGMFAGAHRAAEEGPDFWRRDQATRAREARAAKSAARRKELLATVRAAMKGTPAKPTRGEAFAKLIQPDVEKRLGRNVSLSTIRRYVEAILKERT